MRLHLLFSRRLQTSGLTQRFFGAGRAQRCVDESLLLFGVHFGDTSCRRRCRCTPCIEQLVILRQPFLQPMTDLVPAALVLRFFLTPYDLACIRILANTRRVFLDWEWIQLFNTNDCDVVQAVTATRIEQIEINLAGADTTRVTLCVWMSSISSMIVRKEPRVRSSRGDTDNLWRSKLFGVMTMSGLRNGWRI